MKVIHKHRMLRHKRDGGGYAFINMLHNDKFDPPVEEFEAIFDSEVVEEQGVTIKYIYHYDRTESTGEKG